MGRCGHRPCQAKGTANAKIFEAGMNLLFLVKFTLSSVNFGFCIWLLIYLVHLAEMY